MSRSVKEKTLQTFSSAKKEHQMHLKTIFNSVTNYKPFVVERIAMTENESQQTKVAKMLRRKRELLLNWFRADGALSSGVVEGINNKLKLITRKSYGFRTQTGYETALYHTLGHLPEPNFTHRFF